MDGTQSNISCIHVLTVILTEKTVIFKMAVIFKNDPYIQK